MKLDTVPSTELDPQLDVIDGKKLDVNRINYSTKISDEASFEHLNFDTYLALKVMLAWLGYMERDLIPDRKNVLTGLQDFLNENDTPIETVDEWIIQKVNRAFKASLETDNYSGYRQLEEDLKQLGFARGILPTKFSRKLKEFQTYYGLKATGEVTIETLVKIDTLLSDSIKLNDSHDDLPVLKEYLNLLGYGPIQLTRNFGDHTERAIKKFQKLHKLPVSGMIDEKTREAIYQAVCDDINHPKKRSKSVIYIKKSLNRLGFGGITISSEFGEFAIDQLKNFQTYYGIEPTGKVDIATLKKMEELLSSPLQLNKRSREVITLKENLIALGYGPISKTKKFGKQTEIKLKEFQRDNGLPPSGIADKETLQLIEEKSKYTERITYYNIDLSIEEALKYHLKQKNQYRKETFNQVLLNKVNSFDPERMLKNEIDKFQFLNFERYQTVDKKILKKYLVKNRLYSRQHEHFIEAAALHGINEIVLISHVLLEKERGYHYPDGIPVDKSGRITYVNQEDGQHSNAKIPGMTKDTHTIVYNVYGIFDGEKDTLDARAKKAFEEDWQSLERAIVDGAKLIKQLYTSDGRPTYYSKKWELPIYQTRSDLEVEDKDYWLYKQLQKIHEIYRQLDSYILYLEIPQYNNDLT